MLEAQLEDELEQSHLDVTLTNTTLLSIFFGLVVVCGVFFGFGYSLGGHKAIAAAPAKEFTAPRPMPETASLSASSAPAAPKAMEAAASKPAAGVVTSTSGGRPAESATSLPAVIAPAKPSPVAAAVAANHTDAIIATKTKTVSSSLAPAASVVAPAATAGRTYMVQVAALAHPGDADILCNALRRKGYSVIMASSKQDKLLHVQVGPFASADEAKAMRDKLTGDGYSPILK